MIPFFSVIIPTYNTENYIGTCIKSIINQSARIPYEIICVDDCSNDHTVEHILELQKQYDCIRFFQKECNSGVSDSRNIGIENARGKYILFVDGDDYIMPNTFSRCHKMVEQYNLDLLCFNATGLEKEVCFSFLREDVLKYLTKIHKGHPEYLAYITNIWLLCYRRDFLVESGVRFSNKKVFEDWEFLWHLYPKANKVKFINQALYVYRTQGNLDSLTHKVHKRDFKFELLLDTYIDSIKELKKEGKYSQYEYVCLQRGCEIFFHFFILRISTYHQLEEEMKYFSKFLHIPHPIIINKVISDTYFGLERYIINAIYRNSIYDRVILFLLLGSNVGLNIDQCYQSAVNIGRPFKIFGKWILNIHTFGLNSIKAVVKITLNILRKFSGKIL